MHKIKTIVYLAAVMWSTTTLAHHSQSYFSKEFTELSGELVEVVWRNPHVRFTLRTLDENGSEQLHNIETNSIYYLERAGVYKDRLNVGDSVTIGGHVSTLGDGGFLAAEITPADGENLQLIRQAVTKRFQDEIQDTVKENKGFYRIWSIPQDNQRVSHTPMTEAAKAKKAQFNLLDNFTTRCEPAGMPRIMWYPHPYEFVDQGDTLLLRTEMYDTERTIHLSQSTPPENHSHSRLGYSIGTWQDNKLIVKTTHINWPFYDTQGVPLSDQVEVLEEFTLSEDQSRIDLFITTTDPESFTEPATIAFHWLALGEQIKPYDCEVH